MYLVKYKGLSCSPLTYMSSGVKECEVNWRRFEGSWDYQAPECLRHGLRTLLPMLKTAPLDIGVTPTMCRDSSQKKSRLHINKPLMAKGTHFANSRCTQVNSTYTIRHLHQLRTEMISDNHVRKDPRQLTVQSLIAH